MTASQNGLNLIKQFEGLRLKAYLCSAGRATIGYGATFYPDSKKVQLGETITLEGAEKLLAYHVGLFAKKVDEMITATVNQNQFDSLVSFAYNVGAAALQGSTLLKAVNANPNDINIMGQFIVWNKSKGKILPGLTKRRKIEAENYFTP